MPMQCPTRSKSERLGFGCVCGIVALVLDLLFTWLSHGVFTTFFNKVDQNMCLGIGEEQWRKKW